MTLAKDHMGSIGLHMNGFLQKLTEEKLPEVFQEGKFAMEKRKLETLARQIVGALLWVGQLHFNISFDLAILGATIKEFSTSPANAKLFFLRSNRVIRDLRSRMEIFRYRDFLGDAARTLNNLKSMLILFLFTDAGYASLAESKSTRAFSISFGVVKARGEILSCSAWFLTTCSGEIPRVAR